MAAGPLIGIDIGSQQIKIAELRPGKTGLTITALGIGPTPVGIVQNNIITDPSAMGTAIKQLMRESGISIKRAVGCISGQNAVVIRIIEVPRMTDAELKETMKWEVERHVPFAPSETVLDYQPLVPRTPEAAESPNMEVLLAVAQQDAVSNYIDTLFAAGLDPTAIDIEPLAISRAILDLQDGRPVARPQAALGEPAFADAGAAETVAIVNIGAANTDIAIFQGGQLTFPRSLPLAGDSLTRAIAEALQYTVEQAERVKRDYAVVQLDRMAVYTGTAYEEGYETPQFQDEDHFNLDDAGDNPFDLNAPGFGDAFRTESDAPLGGTAFGGTPAFGDPEDAAPAPRRTLNLASPAASDTFRTPSCHPPTMSASAWRARVAAQTRASCVTISSRLLRLCWASWPRNSDAPSIITAAGARRSLLTACCLTGGSAGLTNLAAFLQNELTSAGRSRKPSGLAPGHVQALRPVLPADYRPCLHHRRRAGRARRRFQREPVAQEAQAGQGPKWPSARQPARTRRVPPAS